MEHPSPESPPEPVRLPVTAYGKEKVSGFVPRKTKPYCPDQLPMVLHNPNRNPPHLSSATPVITVLPRPKEHSVRQTPLGQTGNRTSVLSPAVPQLPERSFRRNHNHLSPAMYADQHTDHIRFPIIPGNVADLVNHLSDKKKTKTNGLPALVRETNN